MSKIQVSLPDNSKIEIENGFSALDLANQISSGLAKNAVAAKINGELKDIRTTLTDGDSIQILTSKDPETLYVLRHSTSHIMAQAVIALFPQGLLDAGIIRNNHPHIMALLYQSLGQCTGHIAQSTYLDKGQCFTGWGRVSGELSAGRPDRDGGIDL